MNQKITVYNTLTKQKEPFNPITPPYVGIYVCGPTVYGDAHLGHARPEVTFDVIRRYLVHVGYKVRFVKNITDVGHLENDADEGEDKIQKKARLEQLEPMEVVQNYTVKYHRNRSQLNVLPPDIEPRASAHIIEQIEMIKNIIKSGFAYEVNGSVYFDVHKYSLQHQYGILSGRILEDLLAETRELDGQKEKRHAADFALWKKASLEHIMRWPSPWSEGFPGWHIECSAMSAKYLGIQFDIHGGGLDLLFPHHECEIAQSISCNHVEPVKYWLHNNMITINGQKMGKSLGNFITLDEFFSGKHPLLHRAYTPMTIRFFMLQAHYRGTLDFSNEALDASEKAYKRMMNAIQILSKVNYSEKTSEEIDVRKFQQNLYSSMNDDFNTPMVIAHVFEAVKWVHLLENKHLTISENDYNIFKETLHTFIFDILGLETIKENTHEMTDKLMSVLVELRQEAKNKKDYSTSDAIRDKLKQINIILQDSKEGTTWKYEA